LDASGGCGLATDESLAFEGEDHLVDGGWGGGEEELEVALGGGASVDLGVRPDEGEVLALLFGEGGYGRSGILVNALIHLRFM
jgi:hypothetical protein